MIANERKGIKLKFGTPDSFDQALIRLPSNRTSSSDNWQQTLIELRTVLELAEYTHEIGAKLPDLEIRMYELTQHQFFELEKISFRRDKKLAENGWAMIHPGNIWTSVFPVNPKDDDYSRWKVYKADPNYDGEKPGLALIYIETNPHIIFPGESLHLRNGKILEFQDFTYHIGLVTQEELNELVTALKT